MFHPYLCHQLWGYDVISVCACVGVSGVCMQIFRFKSSSVIEIFKEP